MSLLKINLNTSRINPVPLFRIGADYNLMIEQSNITIVFIDDERTDWQDINAEVLAVHSDITTEII